MKRRSVGVLAVIGVISLLLSTAYAVLSFGVSAQRELWEKPAINKGRAIQRAYEFVASLGHDVKNYPIRRIVYNSYNKEALYLLKQFGYKQARQLIKKEMIPYSYWMITWSGVADEMVAVVIDSLNGQVISYRFYHSPATDDKVINISEKKAREMANSFVNSRGVDLSSLELLTVNKNTRNIQDEYYFKWKRKNIAFGEAAYILSLSLEGNTVASYLRGLELPKSYKYWYDNSRFISNFWLGLSLGFSLLLGAVLILVAIVKRKALDWKLGRFWAMMLGIVFLIHFLNEQSSQVFYIDITLKVITTIAYSLVVLILVPVTRLSFQEAFGKDIFIKKTDTNTAVSASLISCYSFTFISFVLVGIAYEILFRQKMCWVVGPGGVIGQILTSKIIHLSPFLVGIIPAFIEEFFRGFTMSCVKKICKSTFIAIAVSAFLWGFGHTAIDGSLFPGYLVGVEKFIDGILVGYILFYFGIEVAIAWHFLNNFLAINLFLISLGSNYAFYATLLSAIIILPFFLSIYLYFKKSAITFQGT